MINESAVVPRRAVVAGTLNPEPSALAPQALKQVKGVLNKLTPEKFERLLEQLLDAVKSVEVLRGLITLIFENAVAQVRAQGLGRRKWVASALSSGTWLRRCGVCARGHLRAQGCRHPRCRERGGADAGHAWGLGAAVEARVGSTNLTWALRARLREIPE